MAGEGIRGNMRNDGTASMQNMDAQGEQRHGSDGETGANARKITRYAPLIPLIAGLACARVGLNASVYSNASTHAW